MVSPGGWIEPGLTRDFDEMTVVLRGRLRAVGFRRRRSCAGIMIRDRIFFGATG